MITRQAAIAAFEAIERTGGEVRFGDGGMPGGADGILAELRSMTDAEVASAEAQANLRTILTLTKEQADIRVERLARGDQSDPIVKSFHESEKSIASACATALSH